jgi:protein tyrosine/serine phosphatase
MASLLKQAKRSLRRRSGALLHNAIHHSPPWLRAHVAPALCYAEMLFVDYGVVRVLYNNRHQISPDAWRSAQPAPHHIGWIAARGVKTIINLRGDQSFGTRWLEERACRRNGVALVDIKLRSRVAPPREDLLAVRKLLNEVQYPILVHCKSGADRAGLMSVLISHVHGGVPIREAMKELSLRFGHFRHADTGVIDAVFERYLADNDKSQIDFWDWVEQDYDPDEINRTFKANGLANRLVNGVLRRE